MEDFQYTFKDKEGVELRLTEMSVKNKVVILSYDSNMVNPQQSGMQAIAQRLFEVNEAAGVYILDQNYDLFALAEEDMGIHPEFAKKFMDVICRKSVHKEPSVQPAVDKKLEDYKNFHDHFALERMRSYEKMGTSAFILGWLGGIFLLLAATESLWNLIGAAVFFAANCNIVYRTRKGDYEQEASKKAGYKVKGRSYDPNDYI